MDSIKSPLFANSVAMTPFDPLPLDCILKILQVLLEPEYKLQANHRTSNTSNRFGDCFTNSAPIGWRSSLYATARHIVNLASAHRNLKALVLVDEDVVSELHMRCNANTFPMPMAPLFCNPDNRIIQHKSLLLDSRHHIKKNGRMLRALSMCQNAMALHCAGKHCQRARDDVASAVGVSTKGIVSDPVYAMNSSADGRYAYVLTSPLVNNQLTTGSMLVLQRVNTKGNCVRASDEYTFDSNEIEDLDWGQLVGSTQEKRAPVKRMWIGVFATSPNGDLCVYGTYRAAMPNVEMPILEDEERYQEYLAELRISLSWVVIIYQPTPRGMRKHESLVDLFVHWRLFTQKVLPVSDLLSRQYPHRLKQPRVFEIWWSDRGDVLYVALTSTKGGSLTTDGSSQGLMNITGQCTLSECFTIAAYRVTYTRSGFDNAAMDPCFTYSEEDCALMLNPLYGGCFFGRLLSVKPARCGHIVACLIMQLGNPLVLSAAYGPMYKPSSFLHVVYVFDMITNKVRRVESNIGVQLPRYLSTREDPFSLKYMGPRAIGLSPAADCVAMLHESDKNHETVVEMAELAEDVQDPVYKSRHRRTIGQIKYFPRYMDEQAGYEVVADSKSEGLGIWNCYNVPLRHDISFSACGNFCAISDVTVNTSVLSRGIDATAYNQRVFVMDVSDNNTRTHSSTKWPGLPVLANDVAQIEFRGGWEGSESSFSAWVVCRKGLCRLGV